MTRKLAALSMASVGLVTAFWATAVRAEDRTMAVIVPWQGQGQIFAVAVDRLRFLGAIEGIMYVESAEGEMNEAFVRCPIVQDIMSADGSTSASGSCEISVAPEDTVFAEMSCKGMQGLCRGVFELTGGTGRFEGIRGSGDMTVRSPVHALAADLTDGTLMHAGAGLLRIPKLRVRLP